MSMDSIGRPRALTIAGSDSGGGAGIQADLKTFAVWGVYGTSAITALTAQNTVAVTAVHLVPPEIVSAQIDAVVTDIGCDAVKTGMLATAELVEAVAAALRRHQLPQVVIDPVMVAKSGDTLLNDDAVQAVIRQMLPLARVVTPNIPEAEVLTGRPVRNVADMRDAARRLVDLGAASALVKGGHLDGETLVDVVCDAGHVHELTGPRLQSRHTHGTGCTMAASVAAQLACGVPLVEAVAAAKVYVAGAMRLGVDVGRGHQPLDHFWRGLSPR
jgi:hydroxymethylpyrimidine/phosphomethylpyrimidine kinase